MNDFTLQTLLDRAGFLAFVQHRVDDRALAEDILQAAYVRALEQSGGLRQEESAVAWFYSVLRNAVVDHYRRSTAETSAMDRWARDLLVSGATTQPAPDDPATRGFICGCIEHVLPSLRPDYAQLLREVDLAGSSLTAYAAKNELTAGNAAVRAHRARVALRKELARTCGACSIHACLDCVCKLPGASNPPLAPQ